MLGDFRLAQIEDFADETTRFALTEMRRKNEPLRVTTNGRFGVSRNAQCVYLKKRNIWSWSSYWGYLLPTDESVTEVRRGHRMYMIYVQIALIACGLLIHAAYVVWLSKSLPRVFDYLILFVSVFLPTSMPDVLMRRSLAEFELVEVEVDKSRDQKDHSEL